MESADLIKAPEVVSTVKPIEIVNGRLAGEEVANAFDKADRVYFDLSSGPIGDAVIATGYLNALAEAAKIKGKDTPITVVTNEQHGDLFDGLLDSENMNIMRVPPGHGLEAAKAADHDESEKNALILSFGNYHSGKPEIETLTSSENTTTAVGGLMKLGIEQYPNSVDGDQRYAHFVEDLLQLPSGSIDEKHAQPLLELPSGSTEMYDAIVKANEIDPTRPQIGIIVEASSLIKRYGMEQWAEVIKLVSEAHPDHQFNIFFNPNSGAEGYSDTDIKTTLAEVEDKCHFVTGNLTESAVLLQHQELVLGNDTGLTHIAGAIKDGPPVLTVFSPTGAPQPDHWVSSTRQHTATLHTDASEPPTGDAYAMLHEIAVGQEKPINKIIPQSVAEKALKLLS